MAGKPLVAEILDIIVTMSFQWFRVTRAVHAVIHVNQYDKYRFTSDMPMGIQLVSQPEEFNEDLNTARVDNPSSEKIIIIE